MGWADKFKKQVAGRLPHRGGGIHAGINAAISNQSPVVKDACGRVLEVGDEVILIAPIHTYRVAKVEPVRGDGMPPNVMALQLVSVVQLMAAREQPIGEVVRIQTAVELLAQRPPMAVEEPPPAPPAEVVPPEVKTNRGGLVIP